MINYCPMFIIFGLMLSTAAESVGGCYVYPTSVVVTVGENVRLTCSTNEGSYISSWHIAIDLKRTFTVYAAPVYTPRGTVGQKEIIAEGYFVAHQAYNETTLHINETTLSQAGLYVCTCLGASRGTAATTVVVLDSEPKFKTINIAADGEPVTFSCYLWFNASSDVSCELQIDDASGSTVTKENYAIVNGGLVVCNLNHTIIANASSDQLFTCNVTLNAEGYIIYSKVLNAIVEWQPTSSTSEALSKTLAIRLPIVTVVVVIIVIIVIIIIIIGVVVYFIRSRNGGKMSTPPPSMEQPTDQSSNCPQRPAANRYDKKTIGGPIPKAPATSCNKAAQQDNKSLKEYELTLCENDLYAATSKLLDPSDGYYAEEVVYNEIKLM